MDKCNNSELQAIAGLQSDPGFQILLKVLERRKELCKEQLLYADHTNLQEVQQAHHALGSVLECVQSAQAMLEAEEQQKQDLNNSVYRFRQIGD